MKRDGKAAVSAWRKLIRKSKETGCPQALLTCNVFSSRGEEEGDSEDTVCSEASEASESSSLYSKNILRTRRGDDRTMNLPRGAEARNRGEGPSL